MKNEMAARAVVLVLIVGSAAPAHAYFTGDLRTSYWDNTSGKDLGSIFFTPDASSLVIQGPTGSLAGAVPSVDVSQYVGPVGLGGGLEFAGTLTFNWSFNSGDALSAEAEFGYQNPSDSGPHTVSFASGGPGTIDSHTFSISLESGAVFEFLLASSIPGGKRTAAQFIISNGEYHRNPIVTAPDNIGIWSGAAILLPFAFLGWRRNRQQTTFSSVENS